MKRLTIVEIEGESLTALRRRFAELTDLFASDFIWKIAITIDDGGIKLKVNEGIWSPPMGQVRP